MNEKIKNFVNNPKVKTAIKVTKVVGTVIAVSAAVVTVVVLVAAADGYIQSKVDPEGFARLVAEEAAGL